jgi:PAS domain S-box-containing protein
MYLADTELKLYLQPFIQSIPDGFLMINTDAQIVIVNQVCEKMFEFSEEELIGKSLDILLPTQSKEVHSEHIKRFFQNPRSRPMGTGLELYGMKKSGRLFPISVSLGSHQTDQGAYGLAFIADITERKNMEASLINAVVEGQESERKRLSRELHDGLGPLLSSVKHNMDVIDPSNSSDPDKNIKYLNYSITLLNDAINELRTISQNLMPRILEDFGLVSALKELCERISQTNKLQVSFYSNEKYFDINKEIELGLYRIAQELLNNALKHSKADKINIQLVRKNDKVILLVDDNGIGFDTRSSSKGFGLKNIQSRAKAFNGILNIESDLQKGTITTLEVPDSE